MLKFIDTTATDDEFETCAFESTGGFMTFIFDITNPTALSVEDFRCLSRGEFDVVTEGEAQRYFNFEDDHGKQRITLIKGETYNGRFETKVRFSMYRLGGGIEVTIPFGMCREALEKAAAWRAKIIDEPETVDHEQVKMTFHPATCSDPATSEILHTITLEWNPFPHGMPTAIGSDGREVELALPKEAGRSWTGIQIDPSMEPRFHRMMRVEESMEIILRIFERGRENIIVLRKIVDSLPDEDEEKMNEEMDDDADGCYSDEPDPVKFVFIEGAVLKDDVIQGGHAFRFDFEFAEPALEAISNYLLPLNKVGEHPIGTCSPLPTEKHSIGKE